MSVPQHDDEQQPRDPRAEHQRKLAELLERKSRGAQMRRFERGGNRQPAAAHIGHRHRAR